MIQLNTVTAENVLIRTHPGDGFNVIEIDVHEHDGSSLRLRILSTNAPVMRDAPFRDDEPEFPPVAVEAES